MSTKTVSLDEEAYERLSSMKRDTGKSFSDVVKELTRERSLTDIAGIWDDEELREKIEETRAETELTLDETTERIA